MCITSAQYTRAVISSGLIEKNEDNFSRPLCFTPELDDEYFLERLNKIKKEKPDLYQKMLMPQKLTKTSKVGDIQSFFVNVDDGNGGDETVALVTELLAKGDHSAIWADTSKIGTNITVGEAESYLKAFEENTPGSSRDSTKGIYDLLLTYFGDVPNKDGDGVVDYIFADLPPGIGGYFSPLDQSDQTGSNKRDIFNIGIYKIFLNDFIIQIKCNSSF